MIGLHYTIADGLSMESAVDSSYPHISLFLLVVLVSQHSQIGLVIPNELICLVKQLTALARAVAVEEVDEPSLVEKHFSLHLRNNESVKVTWTKPALV